MVRPSHQFADATSGVVYIHTAPAALCPHVEWALSGVLDSRAHLRWTPQPVSEAELCATIEWVGPVGTGGRLADALRAWPMLRFEVTEDPSEGVDGERYSFVPGLGLWHGSTSANGDVTLSENRLRAIMALGQQYLATELEHALGTVWDHALEPYRGGGDCTGEVTWLHRNAG